MSDTLPPVHLEEDARLTRRQRNALKGPSRNESLRDARSAQEASQTRIRISRKVLDQQVFREALRVWHGPVEAGIAKRKSLGQFAITLFDTAQQPLRSCLDCSKDELTAHLERTVPSLFDVTNPIPIKGIDTFGSMERPFIGLTFGQGVIFDERRQVRDYIAPELQLDARHEIEHRLHLSLGQLYAPRHYPELRSALTSALPKFVEFSPVTIQVDRNASA